jgi:hypothetical protein
MIKRKTNRSPQFARRLDTVPLEARAPDGAAALRWRVGFAMSFSS